MAQVQQNVTSRFIRCPRTGNARPNRMLTRPDVRRRGRSILNLVQISARSIARQPAEGPQRPQERRTAILGSLWPRGGPRTNKRLFTY